MLPGSHRFWQSGVFTFVLCSTSLFVVITVIAMYFYPGGSLADPNTLGYSFSQNFFSDLGRWTTKSGASNQVSATLFLFALALAGSGLAMFFLAFPQFFRKTRSNRILSLSGSVLGVSSGLCFMGVAFFSADKFLFIHGSFVNWAFRLFAAAVLFYSIAIFRHSNYPRRYGWALVGFLAFLIGYILLLQFGPSPFRSHRGEVIQAVGQKIIVYASIISVTFQAWGAKRATPS
jgi:hypothetical membrane protein